MRLLVATDAWHPQVNGVVRSLEQTAAAARRLGVDVSFLTPERFRTMPLPSYPEIRLALAAPSAIAKAVAEARADRIHIATEGPIGLMTRRSCLKEGRSFTTSYHTAFPDYLALRTRLPRDVAYAWLRRFHNAGAGTLVPTAAVEADLAARGFRRLMRWSRGVDPDMFRPDLPPLLDLPRPVFLSVGRLAVEKNLDAFLSLDLPGSKLVVGDGPQRRELEARYPAVHFAGILKGADLARAYTSADVFVFPSLTDTFGIVLLEALASGVPVAAYPTAGPLDVIGTTGAGVLDDDLAAAARACLAVDRALCRAVALERGWDACARQFIDQIEVAHAAQKARAAA